MAAAAAAAVAASKAAREGRTEAEEERREACLGFFKRGWRCILTSAFVFAYAKFLTLFLQLDCEWWYRTLHYEDKWKDAVKRVHCADVSASGLVLLNCELDEHGSHFHGPGAFRNHTHAGVGLKTITEMLQCVETCSWQTGCTHHIQWKVVENRWSISRVFRTDSESFSQSCGVQNPALSWEDTDFPFSGTYFAESIGVGSFKVMTEAAAADSYSGFVRHWAPTIQIPLDLPVEWPAPLPEGWEPAVETHSGQRSIVYYRKPAHPSGVLFEGRSIGTIRTRFMSNDWNRKDVTVVGEVTERRSNKTVMEFRHEWYGANGLWAGTWSEGELWKRFGYWRAPYFMMLTETCGIQWIVVGYFCIFWLAHLLCSVPCLFCMDPCLSFRQVVASAVMAWVPALAIVLLYFAWPWIMFTSHWWIGLLLLLLAVALCSIRCCCCPRACVVLTPCTQRCLEAVKQRRSKPMGKQPHELEVPPSNDDSTSQEAKLVMCRVVGASHDTTEVCGPETV